jgi:sialate O-acetylesterase
VKETIADLVGSTPESDLGMVDGEPLWADPELEDADWESMPVPAAWEAAGYPGMDGIGWYRTSFRLSPAEAAAGITLGLGAIDDSDITWVNGREVGRMEMAWNVARVYEVPPELLRPGQNVLAIRVEDTGGGGGIQGQPGQLFWESGGVRRSLAGDWKFRVGYFTVNLEDHKREVPTVLFNHMVHPLLPFPVKGVLWYQGESNAGPDDAFVYRDLFARLIRQWRQGWGSEELPFLFVQLAGFMAPPIEPQESSWALLRESQAKALELPATAQALALDVGDAFDVHPRNKQAVGHRLALAARHLAYGEDLVFSGPVYAGHEIKGSRVILTFDHQGTGLVARDPAGSRLRGFAIAGSDQEFVWANATIEGDRVVVWHVDIPEPVAVRYGWADNPEGANLQNREGLPAAPFRTDSW